MTNKLIVPEVDADKLALMSWSDIADLIWDTVTEDEKAEALPIQVIKAVELSLSGLPRYKVARELNVSSRTIKNWIEKYPEVRAALTIGTQLLSRWRLAKIEQQFLDAVEKSKEVLTLDPTDTEGLNIKLLGVQAQHARYIMDKMLSPQVQNLILNINAKEDDTGVYRATKEALDYIRSQAVEGEFTEVADVEPEFGSFGVITTKGNEAQCHICGVYQKDLNAHIEEEHELDQSEYEVLFRLPHGTLSKWETTD